ncbi:MAG: peptidylprolyl isomerase, partial [Mariprofundaceae bacterium]|nr:peptidylprolyl isomerase [Mariprofundaceae bacterium]
QKYRLAKLTAMKLKITYLSLLCVWLSACQEESGAPVSTNIRQTPVAQVGEQIIYKEDVDAELRGLPDNFQYLSQNNLAQKKVLDTLIRRTALSQQAFLLGLDQDPLIHREIQRSRDSIMIGALRDWELVQIPTPDAEAIQQYYDQHISSFTIPEQIHARHILVRQKSDALEIIQQLKDQQEDFATLAISLSIDDSNKSRGGDLNWFPHGIMVPAFEKAAFALKNEGDISPAVKTQYGWHIIELLGKRPAYKQTLAESKEEILQILRQQVLDAWMDKLVQESQVNIIAGSSDQSEPAL